jgi:zinc/manganese transport system substrate-binding protein
VALALPLAVAGSPSIAQSNTIPVVATFSILGDLVKNVGGDLVEVETIVGANADAHTFEPAPQQVISLSNAVLIFENGVELEPWLDDIVSASATSATRIVVTEGIPLRSAEDDEHDEADSHESNGHDNNAHEEDDAHEDAGGHESNGHDDDAHEEDNAHEGDNGHQHGEFDPHVWTDVANAQIMVQNISNALIAADPDRADQYRAQTESYLAELSELDAEIVEMVSAIPEDQRLLVTSHDTFGYFADRYGFVVIGTPLGISTEASDPSAGDIARLIETIQETGVPAIFTENVQNLAVMEQIANDAGVELLSLIHI